MVGQAIVALWAIMFLLGAASVAISYILTVADVFNKVTHVLSEVGVILLVICVGTGALGLVSMIVWAFFTGQMGPY